jgi:hypothetical protein
MRYREPRRRPAENDVVGWNASGGSGDGGAAGPGLAPEEASTVSPPAEVPRAGTGSVASGSEGAETAAPGVPHEGQRDASGGTLAPQREHRM